MKMTGYKATDANMQCRGFQFELGKWFEIDGEIKLCERGFHFCEQPSGVWNYYDGKGTRVFKVEAEDVSPEKDETVGASIKRVCRKIRLVDEIQIGGYCNTGYCNTRDYNTGNRNTGNYNTGDCNTGNRNTGDYNTGNRNTGNRNTGDYNTGNRNTGDCNTGNRNTGNRNTGDCNTGNRNTGNYNTGNHNTGYGNTGNHNTGNYNTGDYNTGYFCQREATVVCFDVDTKLTRGEFSSRYSHIYSHLMNELRHDDPISFDVYKDLPGITPEKLASLHQKMIDARKRI